MSYFTIDNTFGRNRKVMAAGREATLLFVGLLQIHQDHGEGGVIPANRADPVSICLELSAFQFSPEEVRGILLDCSEAGLIEIRGDEAIALAGFNEEFMKTCSSCRSSKLSNPRTSTCDDCKAKKKARKKPVRRSPRNTALNNNNNINNPPTPQGGSSQGDASQLGAEPNGGDPEPSVERKPPIPSAVANLLETAIEHGIEPTNPGLFEARLAQFARDGGGHIDFRRCIEAAKRQSKTGDPIGLLNTWLKDPYHWRGISDEAAKAVILKFSRPQGDTQSEPERVSEAMG